MTLSVAKAWVDSVIRHPQPQKDMMRSFEQAAKNQVFATLLVGKGLTRTHKAFLVRWDGLELVVVELHEQLQQIWNVDPNGILAHLSARGMILPVVATVPIVGITEVDFEGKWMHQGTTPLTGTCRYQYESRPLVPDTQWAVRLNYFHPDWKNGDCAMMSYLFQPWEDAGTFNFRFPPFRRADNPVGDVKGPVALFLQVFAADDWVKFHNCRKISNVASALLNFE
jgi:hypothetical protein